MSSFRIVGAEQIAEVGFLSVDRVRVGAADGETLIRHVVRHPGAVVVVPIETGGAGALLVRQFRAALGRDLLELPAGKRDVDGEPPDVTAARELREEIGFRPGRLVKLAEFYNSPGFTDEYTHLFAAFDIEPTGARVPQGPEEQAMTIERVAFRDVESLIAAGEIVDAKSMIGLLLARDLGT